MIIMQSTHKRFSSTLSLPSITLSESPAHQTVFLLPLRSLASRLSATAMFVIFPITSFFAFHFYCRSLRSKSDSPCFIGLSLSILPTFCPISISSSCHCFHRLLFLLLHFHSRLQFCSWQFFLSIFSHALIHLFKPTGAPSVFSEINVDCQIWTRVRQKHCSNLDFFGCQNAATLNHLLQKWLTNAAGVYEMDVCVYF